MIEALSKLADENGMLAADVVRSSDTSEWAWDLLEAAGLEDASAGDARRADRLNREKMRGLQEGIK